MKKIFTILSAFIFSSAAFAQIPNASFENWSNGFPVGWVATGDTGSIVQSTDAYSGTYAAKLHPVVQLGYSIGSALATVNANKTSDYFSISTKPVSYTGWYILNVSDSDNLTVVAIIRTSLKTDSGYIYTHIFTPTSVYKQFAYNFQYGGSGTADSGALEFWLFTKTGDPLGVDSNDYYIVDDLAYSQNSAGINSINNEIPVLEPCSPNPATNVANIIYSLPATATVTVYLYDILGHEVKTLLDNTKQTPGRYKIPTDVSSFANGIYFYSINVDGKIFTQKLTVTH